MTTKAGDDLQVQTFSKKKKKLGTRVFYLVANEKYYVKMKKIYILKIYVPE